jgi:organic hydroperoxide reductase OsmC/OhrA
MHRVDGRLRVEKTDVALQLGNTYKNLPNIEKVIKQFEDFCVVTQSVRNGFDVNVEVRDLNGELAAL